MLSAAMFDMLRSNRKIFVYFLEKYSIKQLNTIPEGFSNNVVWNIAHVVSSQEGLTYGLSGLKWTAPKELVKNYTRGTKPEGDVDQKFVDMLKVECMASIDRLEQNYNAGVFQNYKEYSVATGDIIKNIDQAIQFNFYHEGLHLGYIMSLKKFLK